jgi:ribosomal protein S21
MRRLLRGLARVSAASSAALARRSLAADAAATTACRWRWTAATATATTTATATATTRVDHQTLFGAEANGRWTTTRSFASSSSARGDGDDAASSSSSSSFSPSSARPKMTRKEEEEYDEQIPRRLRGGGMHVLVRNDDVEQAIRKLSRAERDEGIAREFKKREYYLKPSAQRRLDKKEREHRQWKREMRKKLNWIVHRKARGF